MVNKEKMRFQMGKLEFPSVPLMRFTVRMSNPAAPRVRYASPMDVRSWELPVRIQGNVLMIRTVNWKPGPVFHGEVVPKG
jgi:hypothetical protein